MSVVLKNDIFNTPAIDVPLDGSTAIASGALVYRDTANQFVETATSSAGDSLTLFGVAIETVASGATEVGVIPIVPNPGQIWEVDTTSNTAADQLMLNHALTDGVTIKNTATTVATVLGVFIALRNVGAAADKKQQGYFVGHAQVTA